MRIGVMLVALWGMSMPAWAEICSPPTITDTRTPAAASEADDGDAAEALEADTAEAESGGIVVTERICHDDNCQSAETSGWLGVLLLVAAARRHLLSR